ncbi:unnamed protein product [Brassicogethes aeneus]|uniref:F-box domain-containing protein n=1 Tax=Brassicogethes aeneus TaxID=1431903 RepID=A0A9P0FDB7_BRAAE|nr:unnamed protein product [Brassicogethes aeneus]
MEFTPNTTYNASDSGHVSSFDNSLSFYGSSSTETTPLTNLSRKRKFNYEIPKRNLTDVLESPHCFNSTFNESLSSKFSNCHIKNDLFNDIQHNKVFKRDVSTIQKIHSAPCTPVKQVKIGGNTRSFVKCYPEESPLKEARSILYPKLKPLEPPRRILSPLKLKKFDSPAKKCLFLNPKALLQKVITNSVIMSVVLKNLSNGDLYRLSKVSESFRQAINNDLSAVIRLRFFDEKHKKNKENYQITPPPSPEKCTETPPSPSNRNFKLFLNRTKSLDKNESLRKCDICSKVAVVMHNIAQCESISCGYICCLNCNSSSFTAEEFNDKCNGARLGLEKSKENPLTDMSNTSYSFFNNSSASHSHSTRQESGFYSDMDSPVVKRNLNRSFTSTPVVKKVLASNNNRIHLKSRNVNLNKSTPIHSVIKVETTRLPIEVVEPPSPPRAKNYVACSKQSKKNLKRLTR